MLVVHHSVAAVVHFAAALDSFGQKYEAMPADHKKIIQLIAQDYTNQEITDELGIPVGTVKTTINRICDNIFGELVKGLRRRRELRRLYIEYLENQLTRDPAVVCGFPGRVQNCLAVYGSLADPDSLKRTLVDHLGQVQYIPAYLDNHTVYWGLPSYRPLVDGSGASVKDLYLEWLVVSHTPKKNRKRFL